ncbi:GMC oxidoreductase-domain-containing protein [Dichomitus squalens]|uniref:GMC oxidoreductase-domain-containing protein n=1 Tax=Dichomitus squalens TaxID=114155 RepID=A0A4Q9M960_9APHY|nr:GMC oxidoreductase-domain-containing protein [Dichomitus squalens]
MFVGRQQMAIAPPTKPGARYLSLVCALSRALSHGTVHIASADPLAPSRIDPNYFGSEADHDLYVHVLQHTVKGLVEYIKKNGFQVFHPVGTAAMIARADGGVVDPTLKVFGTRNLRVVDLSVLPMEFVCHAVGSVRYLRAAADILKSELPGKPGN